MQVTMDLAYTTRDSMAVSMDYMNNVAVVHAAAITRDWDFHAAAQSFFWDWICSGYTTYTTFGRGYFPKSPSLGDTVTAAALAAVYVKTSQDWALVKENPDFVKGARAVHAVGHLRY